MKTVFIVNPAAGQGKGEKALLSSIQESINQVKADGEIYITRAVGDATAYVKSYCETYGVARFIACGGDGTLSEVLNGVSAFPDAEVGVVPLGTGNGFCRNFGDGYDFCNLAHQMTGNSILCDAIRYRTNLDRVHKEGYCVNMFNIGFDCNVADRTAEMKKKPLISGSFAYFLSILVALMQKKTMDLKIELDGEMKQDGELLLTSVANGSFCGGGIKSNPLASVVDGFMDINMIQNVSRLRFISLLPYYMKGTFLKVSGIEKYIRSEKCREVILTPKTGRMRLCIDGEVVDAGRTEFKIVPEAFRFVLPGTKTDGEKEKEFVTISQKERV